MAEEKQPITNPLLSYSVNSEGTLTVTAEGEVGGKAEFKYNDIAILLSSAMGLEDGARTLKIFETEGVEAAFAYLAASEIESIPDDFMEKLLEQGD